MRGSRSATILLALAGAACAQPAAGVPRWDANVDAPRQETGPRILPGGGNPLGGSTGGSRSTPGCYAQLLVIFDRSGSMGTLWTGGSVTGTRWRLAADALTAAVEPLQDRLQIGAILFPTREASSPGECTTVDGMQIDYSEGPAFLSAWADLWTAPTLLGSTPIDTAFDAADEALVSAHEVTAVVLLTDGEPTCTGPTSAIARAAAWHARGIDTWAIGLPGTGGSDYLASIAAAGGTGAALSVEDPAALTAGLTGILGAQVDQACGD